jgi:hypothetical protein
VSDGRLPYEKFPAWVKFTMLGGAQPRNRLISYFVVVLIVAVAFLAVGLANQQAQFLKVGVVGLFLAAFYPPAIWWVDRNGTWPPAKPQAKP